MVMSASAIPPAMPARPPAFPPAVIALNAVTMPIVVPSRPTNGAVEPTVARMPRPRLNSESTISICRSTARSAELMSAAVMVARSRSSGFTSCSAPPRTRATWLALVLLGQRDGLVELLFLNRPGEVRARTSAWRGALVDLPELVQGDRQRKERHDQQRDDDASGEGTGVTPQCENIYTHKTAPLTVRDASLTDIERNLLLHQLAHRRRP